jgi:hypothetical protein
MPRFTHQRQTTRAFYESSENIADMKCAIIEYNGFHDLTFPTLVYILRQLGISYIDIFTTQKNIDRKIWDVTDTPVSHVICCDGHAFRVRETLQRYRKYDFVVMNTVDEHKDYLLPRMSSISRPTLAIFHTTSRYRQDPDYVAYFAKKHRQMVVLGKHVAESLSDVIQAHWILHCYQGEQHFQQKNPRTTFCVQGLIEYFRRNYHSLIEAVAQLRDEGMTNFIVRLIGGSAQTQDHKAFTREIRHRKLTSFFEFTDGDVPYSQYFSTIGTSDFLLPLLDMTTPEYRLYATQKVTSSLAISLGLSIIPVLHQEFAKAYQIDGPSIVYENGALASAMCQAMMMDVNEKHQREVQLDGIQERLLQQSVKNMKHALRILLD